MLHDGKARRVGVIGGIRVPFVRAHTAYKDSSNQAMMTATLEALVEKYGLQDEVLGDVALGAVIHHSKDWNLARECVIGSGLSVSTPGLTLQRACGTSLEAAILIGNKIALGQIDAGIGGGTDSISDAPIVYPDDYRQVLMRMHRARSLGGRLAPIFSFRPRHFKPVLPGVAEPRTGLSMGESMELTAQRMGIDRESQDQLALESHQKAAAAYDEGFHADLIKPYLGVSEDNNMRRDSSIEKLAKLRPVFDKTDQATMTAGNSTPLTDGAASVLLASEDWAAERNHKISAWLTHGQVAAVNFMKDEGLLMAPAYAVSDMLKKAGLSLQDFDFYEIHEAFAAQTLATLKAWESEEFCRERLGRDAAMGSIDRSKLNVKGGSLAVGHPFAATGARIVAVMAKLLSEKGSGRGLISVCTAGGMGVTAIMEAA